MAGSSFLARLQALRAARAEETKGGTALLWAVGRNNVEMATLLLDAGAAVGQDEGKGTALTAAATVGNLECVQLLLERGADPNQMGMIGPIGCTALAMAAHGGHTEVARLLLDQSADPNQVQFGSDRSTAIVEAVFSAGDIELVRLLLDRGADPTPPRTAMGRTPLVAAATKGHLEITRLLLDRGADPNQPMIPGTGIAAMMAQHALACAAVMGRLEIMQLLLVHGADASVQQDEVTPSMLAKATGNQETADCLEAIGDWPALKIAAACRLHADARRLLRRGAIDPSGCSVAEATTVAVLAANALWPGSPGPCAATTALITAATSRWSPDRHALHHVGVRLSVRTVLLVALRLRCRHGTTIGRRSHRQRQLHPKSSGLCIGLPDEVWFVMCGFFRRSDWGL